MAITEEWINRALKGYEYGLEMPGARQPDCVLPMSTAYELSSNNDVIALGNHISNINVINKPWWTNKEKSAMGAACMLSLTLKAKLMLWRCIRRGL